jgi:hypothetical protein
VTGDVVEVGDDRLLDAVGRAVAHRRGCACYALRCLEIREHLIAITFAVVIGLSESLEDVSTRLTLVRPGDPRAVVILKTSISKMQSGLRGGDPVAARSWDEFQSRRARFESAAAYRACHAAVSTMFTIRTEPTVYARGQPFKSERL